MEVGLSAALVGDSAQQAEAIIEQMAARLAPWLPGYRVRILDGNHRAASFAILQRGRLAMRPPLKPGEKPPTGTLTDNV